MVVQLRSVHSEWRTCTRKQAMKGTSKQRPLTCAQTAMLDGCRTAPIGVEMTVMDHASSANQASGQRQLNLQGGTRRTVHFTHEPDLRLARTCAVIRRATHPVRRRNAKRDSSGAAHRDATHQASQTKRVKCDTTQP